MWAASGASLALHIYESNCNVGCWKSALLCRCDALLSDASSDTTDTGLEDFAAVGVVITIHVTPYSVPSAQVH